MRSTAPTSIARFITASTANLQRGRRCDADAKDISASEGRVRLNSLPPRNRSRDRKRRVATATVKGNRNAAEKELRRLLRTIDTGEHVDPTRMTVGAWLTHWLQIKREEISPKTHERYGEIINNFLIPALRVALSQAHT